MTPNEMFNANEKLAFYIVNKYFKQYQNDDDIKQIALIGLWKACRKFDESKDVKFATFATTVIRNDILMELRKNNGKKDAFNSVTLHLDTEIDDDNYFDFYSIVECKSCLNEFYNIETEDKGFYFDCLSDLEQKVLYLYVKEKNQKEIAQILKVSQSYISRVLVGARKKVAERVKITNDFSAMANDMALVEINKTDNQVFKLLKKGTSYKDISKKLNLAMSTVYSKKSNLKKKLGKDFLLLTPSHVNDIKKKVELSKNELAVLELFKQCFSQRKAAEQLGLSISTVRHIKKRLKNKLGNEYYNLVSEDEVAIIEKGKELQKEKEINVLEDLKSNSNSDSSPKNNITEKEQEVLDLIKQGFSRKAMAVKLGISSSSVRSREINLKKKLGSDFYKLRPPKTISNNQRARKCKFDWADYENLNDYAKNSLNYILSSLSEVQQKYFKMYHFEKLSITEIGAMENVVQSTVSRTIKRAENNMWDKSRYIFDFFPKQYIFKKESDLL